MSLKTPVASPALRWRTQHSPMLAYDMNDEPLPFGHGAPLRLRNEVQLGFKQVNGSKE